LYKVETNTKGQKQLLSEIWYYKKLLFTKL
jgi:hypothetical protein